jgi:hypothetical protein
MKQFFVLALTIFATIPFYAQIGINTESPMATLDVTAPLGTNIIAGMQAPRLTLAELTAKGNSLYGTAQIGAIIYISNTSGGNSTGQRVNITTSGYYYFDGAVWQKLGSFDDADISTDIIGDVKYSFSTADHAGWYLLDGRGIAGLSATAKAAAAGLGFTNNLPDGRDRVLKTRSTTEALAAKGGSNTLAITQANLPNISLAGTISGTSASGGAAHTHTLGGTSASGGTAHTHAFTGASASAGLAHTHTFTGTAANGGAAHTHTFSGTSASAGAHTHTITVPPDQNVSHRGNPASSDISVDSRFDRPTSSAGAHTHTFSATSTNNTHTHTFSGASASNTHTHSFSGVSTDITHTHTFSGTSVSAGAHTHTATGTATVPTGGSGAALDNRDPYLAVNAFVYLGL